MCNDHIDNSSSNIGENIGGVVYFTPNVKSYHSTKSCRCLAKSKTILEGSLDDDIAKGKVDHFDNCVEQ